MGAKTAGGFQKRSVQEAMLPPEVENLQRVVYSMEVLKNSLLRELRGEAAKPSADLRKEWERYFSGVGQLVQDFQHYKQVTMQQRESRSAAARAGRRGRRSRSELVEL